MPDEPKRAQFRAGPPGDNRALPGQLDEGELVSDRFVVERIAGRGGMGAVYRAHDRLSGAPVALKVIAWQGQPDRRFAQEARVLAELSHPAIVRYLAHGETARGQPYLAMQWLDGEDLAKRLAVSPLTVAESLQVARRVAEGLSLAHGRGIVHRDVKPSNVLLVDGLPSRATLLDFGIARTELSGTELTRDPITGMGVVLGTVGYMSPEQATGDPFLDARTDVFALGCLLFQCLTGQPAFSGEHVVAVLAKVLREEAPRVRALRPELPDALDELVARMLSKDRASRARDGGAVERELSGLGPVAGGAPTAVVRAPEAGLSSGERRMVSVILARLDGASFSATSTTGTHDRLMAELSFVRARAIHHGGQALRLSDGTLLVTFSGDGATAKEQASRAALCAHQLGSSHPAAAVALATGFAQTAEPLPVGAVIDRAAAMLSAQRESGTRVDAVTASLVETRFEVREDSGVLRLGTRRRDEKEARTLLGKPTPCVGRDHEIAALRSLLDRCIEDRMPRAVLVTAPPGVGKSRLWQEFVEQVDGGGVARVVVARSDWTGAGSAFVLARQIVQQAAGLTPSDPVEVQHATMRSRLAARIDAKEAGLVAEFLCEAVGMPVQTEPSPALRSARGDPRLLADGLRSSFEAWLRAEAHEPLLVVLEDLHWGDAPTVTYLGRVLKERGLPLMVLALARPDVHEVFPQLWMGALDEISLGGLGEKAAVRLVRAVLPEADAATVTRLVERAEGNAFYLEELVRTVAEGRGDVLPETVVAMAHHRLERLEPRVRRALRAASVLGDRFRLAGLAAIVGSSEDAESSLAELTEREVVTPSRGGRFSGEREYGFRHALVREAAYATLTDEDRSAAHRLAAEWLERAGESDPLVMADHWERGGEPGRAVPWIIRAVEAAYSGGSTRAAIGLAERGLAHAVDGERGVLRAIEGVCAGSQNDHARALPTLRDAMTLLPKGSQYWFVAASNLAFFGAFAGNPFATLEVGQAMAGLPAVDTRGGLYACSASRVVLALIYAAQPDMARSFLVQLESAAAPENSPEPSLVGWLQLARVYAIYHGKGEDLAEAVRNARGAVTIFQEIRDFVALASARFWQSGPEGMLGRYDTLRGILRDGCACAEQSDNFFLIRHFEMLLGWTDVLSGCAAKSVASLSRLADDPVPSLAAAGAVGLARALVVEGDAAGAETAARDALQKAQGMAPFEAVAYATLARVLLARGRPRDSLEALERAHTFPVVHGIFFDDIPLTQSDALAALGRTEEAHATLRKARDRVARIATTLDPSDRASYLTRVDANVRILARAKDWLGEA